MKNDEEFKSLEVFAVATKPFVLNTTLFSSSLKNRFWESNKPHIELSYLLRPDFAGSPIKAI
jgi:hypothetical protein